MGLNVNRTTHSVSFNSGIATAAYAEKPAGQTRGTTQQPLLPGSTTVSRALDEIFPVEDNVEGQILGALASRGSSVALRSANGFRAAALRARDELERGGDAARAAARELERLLDDGDLLQDYRAALLES